MNNHENTAPQPIVGDAHLNVTDAPSTPATTPGAEGVAAQASTPATPAADEGAAGPTGDAGAPEGQPGAEGEPGATVNNFASGESA